jgi:ABC-type transport system substrate-binding protein
MPRRRLLLALTHTALTAAACGGGGSAGADPDGRSPEVTGGELTVVTGVIASTLDPAAEQSASYLRAHGAAEALLRIAADGSIVPQLAADYVQTSPTTWDVTLRDGASFWSGAPVSADAVVASLERTRRLNTLGRGLIDGVRISALDPLTVRFETDGFAPDLPAALAHYQLAVYNADAYGEQPGGDDPAAADLTGPFRVTAFASLREMTLQRFDGWWGAAPAIGQVVVRQVDDPQTRAEVAIAGQADIVQDLPTDQLDRLSDDGGIEVVGAPAANTVTVYLNPDSPSTSALADVRVRQALAWGIDREEVVRLATNGLSVPASSWLASSPAFPLAAREGYTRYDPDLADRLLTEAGWAMVDGKRVRDGEVLRFRLLTFGAEQRTGEVLQAQWARLGIDVAVSNVDSTLITQSLESGDWDAVTQAWTSLGATPALIASQVGHDGAANHSGLRIDGVPELLETARSAPDEADRTAAIYALNRVLIEHVHGIPVHPRGQATAVSAEVGGFVAHPLQYENVVQPEMTVG